MRPERPDEDEAPTLSNEVWELAESCWAKEPSSRPTADAACETLTNCMRTNPYRPRRVEPHRSATAPSVPVSTRRPYSPDSDSSSVRSVPPLPHAQTMPARGVEPNRSATAFSIPQDTWSTPSLPNSHTMPARGVEPSRSATAPSDAQPRSTRRTYSYDSDSSSDSSNPPLPPVQTTSAVGSSRTREASPKPPSSDDEGTGSYNKNAARSTPVSSRVSSNPRGSPRSSTNVRARRPTPTTIVTEAAKSRFSKSWNSISKVVKLDAAALTFKGHKDTVLGVCFSPDGQKIASVSSDGEVMIWSLQTGKMMLGAPLEKAPSTSDIVIAFSQDGRRIFTISKYNTGGLSWDTTTGEFLGCTHGHGTEEKFQNLALSPDSSNLAVGFRDGKVWIYDLEEDSEIADESDFVETTASNLSMTTTAVSSDGKRVLTFADGETMMWDMDINEVIWSLKKGSHTNYGYVG